MGWCPFNPFYKKQKKGGEKGIKSKGGRIGAFSTLFFRKEGREQNGKRRGGSQEGKKCVIFKEIKKGLFQFSKLPNKTFINLISLNATF